VAELIEKRTTTLHFHFANTKMLVTTQWRLVMCLFQKATSCGPLALYKLTTIFVVDRIDDLFFFKGCQMMAIWTKYKP